MALKEVEVRSILGETQFSYVKDGELHVNAPLELVMLESETSEAAATELATLTQCKPGTFAFMPGMKGGWQKKSGDGWEALE